MSAPTLAEAEVDMGKGTISGGGEKGLYTIALDFGTERRNATQAAIDTRIADLNVKLTELEASRGNVDTEMETARAIEDLAIRTYIEALLAGVPAELLQELFVSLKAARAQVLKVELAKLAIGVPIDSVKAEIKALQLQAAEVNKGTFETSQEAWCVDLTEDGTGEVGTIEVPGERSTVLIAPGCRPPVPGDGGLLARHVMSPAQAFFNAAILPGWQKFKPTYRLAVIDAINAEADTADVTLDPATSSAQDLDVNQSSVLTGIPVEYMTCNAAAFSEGDRVVVGFSGQSWDAPRVVGFENNPRSCDWPCVYAANFYAHYFESRVESVWADVFTSSGISVEYRVDRGAWNPIQFDETFDLDGVVLHIYANPPPAGEIITNEPRVWIGGPIDLPGAWAHDPFNGLWIEPMLLEHSGPGILEVRITKSAQVKFNAAYKWDPLNFAPTSFEVLATGGISPKGPGWPMSRLTGYELFIKTGD